MLSLNGINRERGTSQRAAETPTDISHILKTKMDEMLTIKYVQLVLHHVSFGSHLSSKFAVTIFMCMCVHVCAVGGKGAGADEITHP